MTTQQGEGARPSRRKRLLVRLAASLAWLILLIEVVFRIWTPPGFDLELLTLDFQEDAKVIGHPYMGFMLKPGFESGIFAHNSLGFRGPEIEREKPEGTFRIACIGGSSTYGHGPSSEATTWPRLLETKLRRAYPGRSIEVVNCGASGYSTFDNIGNFLLRVVDLEPDLLIVYQTINDVRCGLANTEYQRDNRHWRAVFNVPQKPAWSKLAEKSRTFLLLRWKLSDYETLGDLAKATIACYDKGGMPNTLHEEELECFQRNLRSIVAGAREFGISVMLSTQACYEEHLRHRSQQISRARHSRILRDLAASHRLYLVDNASEELMPQDRALYTNDVHLTDAGTDRLSDNFLRAIREERILDDRRLPRLTPYR